MKVGPYGVGDGAPLLCILGPCVVESEELTLRIAAGITICPLVVIEVIVIFLTSSNKYYTY